jgi:hypothetical protein
MLPRLSFTMACWRPRDVTLLLLRHLPESPAYSSGLGDHAAASLRTTPASLGALLAMRHLMLCALVTACRANIGALLADRDGELAAARHPGGGNTANLRTVHIQCNTACHRLDILFAKTSRRAKITCVSTGIASVHACPEFFVPHTSSHLADS